MKIFAKIFLAFVLSVFLASGLTADTGDPVIEGKAATAVNIDGGTINGSTIGETTPAAGTFTTLIDQKASISTKTDSYVVTTADFGKVLRMNNAAAKIFTFPSVGATEDGALLYIENQGAGRLTLQMVDTDKVMDSAATGTCYTDDDNNATLVLRYNHALVTWQAVGGHGTWITT